MWVFIAGSLWRCHPSRLHQLEVTQLSHQMPWSLKVPLARASWAYPSLDGLSCFPGCSYDLHSVRELPPIPNCLLLVSTLCFLNHFLEGSPNSNICIFFIQSDILIPSLVPHHAPTPPLPKSRDTLLSNNSLTLNCGERRVLTKERIVQMRQNSKQCIWSPQARRILCGWGCMWDGPVSPSTPSL